MEEFSLETQLFDVLNKQIANWSVLFIKLHNFHWYVKGNQFFTLHTKFEEFYNEASLHIDEIAERLLSIGGQPVATMKECLQMASVTEANGNETAEEMVQSISSDYTMLIGDLKEGMSIAEKENDEITGDLLLAIHSSLEKHVWMLKAFLGRSV
jgi:starvation-inducible DNA-binding protein